MRDWLFALRLVGARRFCVPLYLSVLALVRSALSHAEELEQHHAHEHGKVALNVVVAGSALVIELDAPAANVLGFEHPPKDPAERAAVSAAAKYFQEGTRLFGVPTTARCRFASSEVTEPKWTEPGHGARSDGDDHVQHAHYEARFTYQCEEPEALLWFEPWLLDQLVQITATRVNLITPSGQRSEVATTSRTRISLK